MTMRAKLQISAIVLTGCTVAIGVIFLTFSRVAHTATEKATLVNRLAQEIWALNALTNDYVFHHGERAQIQWQSQYASIAALLTHQHVLFTTPQERKSLEAARQDHQSIQDTFARLVALRGARRQPGAEAGPTGALSHELEERLASQILVRSQSMIGAATQLSESSLTAMARADNQSDLVTLSLIIILILVTAGTGLSLYRHIAATMAKLLAGTDVIARGNPDYQVEVESTDEIGQVGRAFNTMAARLKASYEGLEAQIQDRTAALARANAELQREVAAHRQAEERFWELLELAPDAMVIIDHEGKIAMVNAQAETLFGYRRIELLDQPVEILMPDRVRDTHSGHRTRFFTNPQVRPMGAGLELYGQRKDGAEFPVEISLSLLTTAEGMLVTAAIRDITARKASEAEIAAKNRDLQTLLYVTSHDLREPLRAIAGFSRLMQERYAERLDEKGQEFLMHTVHGAQRMDALLNDILALSRAQRFDPPTVAIDGKALVEEAVKRLEARIAERRATVQVARDFPRLYADKIWAMQALHNLIANALKFTRAGAAPDVEILPYRSDGQAGIVVRDRGPGVAPEHAERIFQLFQRAVSRDVEGTGAGLAIVRQVAERHQGRAWVQPRAGGGSEFIITFGRPGT